MHAGVHNGIPSLAAAAMAERRSSVFKNTLKSAAPPRFPDAIRNFDFDKYRRDAQARDVTGSYRVQ